MIIREENNGDSGAVLELVKKAFSTAPRSDGNEHELVEKLHKSYAFIPELSLVAEIESAIVGYILFTQAKAGSANALVLAPLAVLPDFQGRGIGSALIRKGHAMAKKLGYDCILVLGSEIYYPKFGYVPASKFSIITPVGFPETNFMALRLKDGVFLGGKVAFPREFGL